MFITCFLIRKNDKMFYLVKKVRMAKIRDLALFDIWQINKLLSFVDREPYSFFDGIILPAPFDIFYKILPLRFKFLPESYVLTDKKKLLACISVKRCNGNHRKWEISKLLMSDSPHEAVRVLIQYAVTKFAAKGVHTFLAAIEENQNELIQLLIDGAGFRHCSRHQFWRCTNYSPNLEVLKELSIRPFKNSDAGAVCELYNDTLQPHFRPSLNKNKAEFHENIFAGLLPNSQFRYVIEHKERKQLICYLVLKTNDNKNYILDCLLSKGYEYAFESILNYSLKLAQKRTQNLNFYVTNKYCLQTANHFENVLKNNSYEAANSFVILVKDLFRTIKDDSQVIRNVFYTDINSNPAFKSQLF